MRVHPRRVDRRAALLVHLLWWFGAGTAMAELPVWEGEHGSLRVRLSGREIFSALSARSAEDIDREIAESAPDPTCFLAALFEECRALRDAPKDWDWQSLTRLRTEVVGRFHSVLSARVVYDHELLAGLIDGIGGGSLSRRDTFLRTEGDIISRRRFDWRHSLYRGYVTLDVEPLRVRVGRQRIPWGIGRLWKPLDRFNAVPPLAIEPDQSAGVDSVNLRWALGDFTDLNAVYAPGTSRDEARWALRLDSVVFDTDVGAVAGVFEKARTAGAYATGNVLEAAYRIEAVWSDPEADTWPVGDAEPSEPDPYWQVVVSVDRTFELGSGLYVLVEHLYNGNGLGFGSGEVGALLPLFESTRTPPPGLTPAQVALLGGGPFVRPASSAVAAGSRVVTLSEHLTGTQVSYEWASSLRTQMLAIWDWEGYSAAFFPRVSYRGWDFVEIGVGAQLFVGPDDSEYGEAPNRVLLQLDVYY